MRQSADRPAVILFPDCFTVYNEPHIGVAAIEVLESLGKRVVLPKIGCCGRSLISVGMLSRAQTVCADTARSLIELVEKENAQAVVGLEPSCISAIKDDWLELKMDDVDHDRLQTLAARTFLIEEFVDAEWDGASRLVLEPGIVGLPLMPGRRAQSAVGSWLLALGQQPTANSQQPIATWNGGEVILHGHCHQKALWGIETSAGFLRRIVGEENLTVLDSGCCGMAGAFGYARHRYDLSMTIGELSLFPAIRDHLAHGESPGRPDVTIVAPGTSCRHQIRDATGRKALHPIELA